MDIQRMKFAVARGARFQFRSVMDGLWHDTEARWGALPHEGHYRIHPDDEHLQYGRLSTCLRELAIDELTEDDTAAHGTRVMFEQDSDEHLDEIVALAMRGDDTLLRHSMLFYAEYLADEGM